MSQGSTRGVLRAASPSPRLVFSAIRRFTTSSPARFAILVFTSLVLLFTALLSLPISSADGRVTPLADAFFTAVSTICVTGLVTVNMGTHWSAFGNSMIFLGVNIGAMGVLTFGAMMGVVISRRLGLRAKLVAAGDTNPLRSHAGPVKEEQGVRLGEVGQLLRTIALSTLLIEAVVAVLLYPAMLLSGTDPLTALWQAPYFAAMSFTNTGFTPTPDGLASFATNYWFLTVMAVSVMVGSVGFPVIYSLSKHHWHMRKWSLHTKLTLLCVAFLWVAGAVAFLALEYLNPETLGRADAWDTTFQSFFLSVMTRSGGFAVLDMDELNGSSIIVACMLMFVGGGSASTAGGIKVTTLAVLILAAAAEARGRQWVEVFGRRIPSDVQRVALSVVWWGSTIVALSTIILGQITQQRIDFVLFDVISGFATVGLSTGVTESLPDVGKYIMAVTILMGRIGTVTIAAAVAARSSTQLYQLPVERPIVG
ncbi:TrkH family potassium uptake protein [Microbacterium cremeum]|uniref:TrkH family potassium uptake protein n=1 Tax=Microbacterium cremeum TaxID=2782169 RepID=UPI001887EDC8|nr:potassium transporter TrkG [Microbacterium cremeum]